MDLPNGDTCDHCGPAVTAYVWLHIRTSTLAYCGSCATRYWDKLNAAGRVIDLRHLITA